MAMKKNAYEVCEFSITPWFEKNTLRQQEQDRGRTYFFLEIYDSRIINKSEFVSNSKQNGKYENMADAV